MISAGFSNQYASIQRSIPKRFNQIIDKAGYYYSTKATYIYASILPIVSYLLLTPSVPSWKDSVTPIRSDAIPLILFLIMAIFSVREIIHRWKDEYHIRNFELKMKTRCNKINYLFSEKHKERLLICYPKSDHNRAFESDTNLYDYLGRKYQLVPFWISSSNDLNIKVEKFRQQSEMPIKNVIISGHGTDSRIFLGDPWAFPFSSLSSLDVARTFRFLEPGSKIFLNSCSVGQPKGLADQAAKRLNGVQVIAANEKISAEELIFAPSSQSMIAVFYKTFVENSLIKTRIMTKIYDQSGETQLSKSESLEAIAFFEQFDKSFLNPKYKWLVAYLSSAYSLQEVSFNPSSFS